VGAELFGGLGNIVTRSHHANEAAWSLENAIGSGETALGSIAATVPFWAALPASKGLHMEPNTSRTPEARVPAMENA
jgi:hypothetical protein